MVDDRNDINRPVSSDPYSNARTPERRGYSWGIPAGIAAVILLVVEDHMPWAGLVVILGRDLLLLAGYKTIAPEGYELNVNLLGKAATWLLYLGIGCLIVTHRSTEWPYWIFWTGLILAVCAAADGRRDRYRAPLRSRGGAPRRAGHCMVLFGRPPARFRSSSCLRAHSRPHD